MPYKNKNKRTEYNKNYSIKRRQDVLSKLGGVCVICGFSDSRALQIDHINGGGHRERKEIHHQAAFYTEVMKDDGKKYQLLCANCNWIKRYENKEVGNRYQRKKNNNE